METPPSREDRTTANLQNALAALDAAMFDVDELQKKFDSISSRMDTLLVNSTKSPSANLGANLRSLNARSEVLRKALDRARRAYANARKAYHQASLAFAENQNLRENRLSALQNDLATAEQCKGALARTVATLMNPKDSAGTARVNHQTLPGHEGSYGYIPISTARYFDLLIALEKILALDPDYEHSSLRHKPVSFLDIGCGTGRNLVLARAGGVLEIETTTGFDIDTNLISAGKNLFGLSTELLVADAMGFDYGAYDVIFSFRPYYDQKMLAEFEDRLVESMRPSAYLIAVLPDDLARFPALTCVSPTHDIWKKTG